MDVYFLSYQFLNVEKKLKKMQEQVIHEHTRHSTKRIQSKWTWLGRESNPCAYHMGTFQHETPRFIKDVAPRDSLHGAQTDKRLQN